MARFLIGVARRDTNKFAWCFDDHTRSIAGALRSLGHEVVSATWDEMQKGGRLLLWAVNSMKQDPQARGAYETIPEDAIIFQTEQISAVETPKFFLAAWFEHQKRVLWDYSQSNVDELKKIGMDRAVLCPLGYHPVMEVIEPAAEQDIDVLFYGTRGGRRRDILIAFERAKLKVVQLYGQFGAERDRWIARSKVVLNLHYYPNGVFEIFRCSHLFANRVCVLNEAGGRDVGLEALAKKCTSYTPRAQLIERCRELVKSPHLRATIAEQGYEEFKKIDLTENVRRALGQS